MRRFLIVTAAVLAAVVFFLLFTLPPKPVAAGWTGDPSIPRRTVAGAYHVHTKNSDGAGDRAAVAAAAKRAGLQFVIVTDHGDGTALAPPAYVDGVLCIEGAEISTNGGHYVALGIASSPYPLGGEPSAVVEDVARLGGFGIAAHPDSPKPSLAWTDWNVPLDGIEWLNADTEWRNESRARLTRVLFGYLFRPGPALASALDRPVAILARWDALATRRAIVALAGHDAHGGVGTTAEDGKRTSIGGVPSYEASFRSFSTRVVLDAPLMGEAAADGRAVLAAMRAGRTFTTIDALAGPGLVDFQGWQRDRSHKQAMGSTMPAGGGGVEVTTAMPEGAELVVFGNGTELRRLNAPHYLTGLEGFSGSIRVEVRVPGAPGSPPIPWLVTNPIYFLPPAATPGPVGAPQFAPADITWHVEKSMGSDGDLAGPEREVAIDFRLRAGEKASQFTALVGDFRGARQGVTHLALDGEASRPMRVSVQLRYPSGGGERWARSVYLDRASRHIVVPLDEMLPVDRQPGPPPPLDRAGSLLFVVDLVNASPGTSGTFRISNLALGR